MVKQEKVGGPRKAVGLPKLLPQNVSSQELGNMILRTLRDYKDAKRVVYAEEWDVLNQELLEFYGVKSTR